MWRRLLLLALLSTAAGQACQCSCCLGNNCNPIYVGQTDYCSECSATTCAAAFPAACPGLEESGSCIAVCGSPPSPPAPLPPPTTWAGLYQVQGGCSLTACCCLTGEVQISQSGNILSFSSTLVGQCGGTTSMNDVQIYLSSSISDTATFSYDGNDYEAIRSGEEVTVNDLSDTSCTASAKCFSGACTASGSSGSSTTGGGGGGGGGTGGGRLPVGIIVMSVIVGLAAVAGGVFYYFVRFRASSQYEPVS